MARGWREIRRHLSAVQLVVEVADARAPAATRNPRLEPLLAGRPRVLALTHRDLAAEEVTRAWLTRLRAGGTAAWAVDARSGRGVTGLRRKVAEVGAVAGGRRGPVRVMLVGIPNVGKSSLLNRLVGGARARVGRSPGVTRGPQWVAAEGCYYLDLPGVLPPRPGRRLLLQAILGNVPEEAVPPEEAAARLVELLEAARPRELAVFYGLAQGEAGLGAGEGGAALLAAVARARGHLLPGGRPDLRRAAVTLLGDFRAGRLGRISLETPPTLDDPGAGGRQETAGRR